MAKDKKIIKLLLEAGAKHNIKNRKGQTIIENSEKEKRGFILNHLEKMNSRKERELIKDSVSTVSSVVKRKSNSL